MAAIARFISFDGGIAFSTASLKIQKRDEDRGKIIPVAEIAALEVSEPLFGDDGSITVRLNGERRASGERTLYFDDEQYGDAVQFKVAFDTMREESRAALPPLDMFQPEALAPARKAAPRGAQRPARPRLEVRREYEEQARPQRRRAGKKGGKLKKIALWVAGAYAVLFAVGGIALLFDGDAAEPSGGILETEPTAAASEAWVPAGGVTDSPADGLLEGQPQEPADGEKTALDDGWYTLPCGMEVFYSSGVINDVTGRWRLSRTTSAESVADHALEYYQQMFSSDDEVHAIWNASLGTMTSIRTGAGCLFVETHEYVDGEENDAEKLFSGKVLSEKVVNISTGEVSDVNSEDVSDSAASALPIAAGIAGATSPPIMTEAPATPAPTQKPVPAETSYVLNTSTMKFHSPGCRDVGKINAGNRQDYTGTRDSVIAMGYSPCGHCNP